MLPSAPFFYFLYINKGKMINELIITARWRHFENRYLLHCKWHYTISDTALQVTLHCNWHCTASDTALQVTLHCKWNCTASETALQVRLHSLTLSPHGEYPSPSSSTRWHHLSPPLPLPPHGSTTPLPSPSSHMPPEGLLNPISITIKNSCRGLSFGPKGS